MTEPLPTTTSRADLDSTSCHDFIFAKAIRPGLELLLERVDTHPDWPYPDTKFNPNTGENLESEAYQVLYAWLLGRALEALPVHGSILHLLDWDQEKRDDAAGRMKEWQRNLAEIIMRISDRYAGRCPFRLNTDLEAIDPDGRPISIDPSLAGAADIFCAKGLLGTNQREWSLRGFEMLQLTASKIRAGHYQSEPPDSDNSRRSHDLLMLWQGVPAVAIRSPLDFHHKHELFMIALEFLEFIIDHHHDPVSGVFSEYIDRETLLGREVLDPGHCNEVVGLGLSALRSVEQADPELARQKVDLFKRARQRLPRILVESTRLGFNAKHGGICKRVNSRTGEVLDGNLPWWNLPETMRAAAHVMALQEPGVSESEILEIFTQCHHAYFTHYLNPNLNLFPFQTRCGKTGQVMNHAPGVPEGDPLYHSNLSFLDLLAVLKKA